MPASEALALLNGDPMLSRSTGAESFGVGIADTLDSAAGESPAAAGVGDLFACELGAGAAKGSAEA